VCGRSWVSIVRAVVMVPAEGSGCGRAERVVRSWVRKCGAVV